MEWSWRTVLILLGLLLVVGVMIDGFRRMRKVRADSLRFDLSKESDSDDELYHNPELPKPYRVISSAATAKADTDPFFSTLDTTEEQLSAPFFTENNEFNDYSLSADDSNANESTDAFDYAAPAPAPTVTTKVETEVKIEAVEEELEPAVEEELEYEPEEEIELAVEEEFEPEAEIEEVHVPEPLVARPVNLDEDFPVLLDVEELGKDDIVRPQPYDNQSTPAATAQSFNEKEAAPFADLGMEAVDISTVDQDEISYTPEIDQDDNAASVNAEVEMPVQTTELSESNEQDESELDEVQLDEETDELESDQAEQEPVIPMAPLLYASPEAEKLADRAEPKMALVIHCISRDEKGFSGTNLVSLFNQCDVRFGEKEIFHRFEQADGKGSIQFSIVHSFEPRHFSPETILGQYFRGLSLFMKLPGAKNPSAAYEAMVAIAQLLAKHFNADLFDGERSALTQQTIEHERQQIVDFEYRQKVAAKKQALS